MSTEFKYTREWTDAEAFPLLSFTKNWENPDDYPTVETDEMKVRQDMQSLHDEVKNFLNEELIPRVVLEDATVDAWTTSEETRVANETERVAAEEARASAEQARVAVEASRVTTESARVNAESARATAEQGRAGAEDIRVASEAGRVSAEASRVTAESARATVEASRVTAESGRVDAENTRVANENTRISTEQGRKDAEAVRVANENQRIENNNTLVQTTQEAREAIDSVEKLDADWVELPAGSPVYVEKSVNAEGGIQLTFGLSRGTSGVYVGSGTMPDDANIQIDPTGDPTDTAGLMMTKTYDPTGKATDIFKYVDDKMNDIPTPDVSGQIDAHNANPSSHEDIRNSTAPMIKLRHNLTGAGWFRVGLINTDGTSSSVTRLAIGAIYSNVAPSTVVLDVMRVHSEVEIYQQVGITNDTGITQVRACLIDWKTLAFDVYVNATLENPYNINIMPIMGSFTPSSFENVTGSVEEVKASIALTDGGSYAPMYTYGTEDLTAGSSPLESGKLHFVYE